MLVQECISIHIGSRVAYERSHGTVHYVGEVPPFQGAWLGVEWDDPTRGKHDGSYNGVRYFNAKGSTSGSFVRPHKVQRGCSMVQALQNRYGKEGSSELDLRTIEWVQKEINAPFLQFVGFDKVSEKQSNFEQLTMVGLADMEISNGGLVDELKNMAPNIIEIDLSHNLFDSWSSVAEIISQLHQLSVLNVSNNQLSIPKGNMNNLIPAFDSVDHLVMGRMGYTWDDVVQCSTMWNNVTTLQVPFNNITSIQDVPVNIEKLTHLDLQGNKLNGWEQILKLGTLHELQVLNLTNTGIHEIFFHGSPTTNSFSSLRLLHLSENNIDHWESFSELDKLVKLEELKVRENPILDQENFLTGMEMIVARIGLLKLLNGMTICAKERRGSELDYLKRYGREYLKCGGEGPSIIAFTNSHPRYSKLVTKYGVPDECESNIAAGRNLKIDLISVFIVNPDKTDIPGCNRKLPRSMIINRLKLVVSRWCKISSQNITLSYITPEIFSEEIPLDSDYKNLDFYSVSDGDHIYARW